MDAARLSDWLKVFAPRMARIDNVIFVDPWNLGEGGIRQEASKYGSLSKAQIWLNVVLLEGLLDEVVGDDWSFDDPGASQLLTLVEQAWRYQISARWPDAVFRIERIVEQDDGDLGLMLRQD